MKEIVVANFKMNKTFSETEEYVKKLNTLLGENVPKVVLCLPFTSLYVAKQCKDDKISFGAQNMNEEESGSFTGEISASMLDDLNVKYVILGHNDRKKYGETYNIVNKKIKTGLRYNFNLIVCVGDNRVQRNAKKTESAIEEQISLALSGIYENELNNIIFVYEPIWSFGTGKIVDVNDVKSSIDAVRNAVSKLYSEEAGRKVKVLFGGSVNSENAKQFEKIKTLNGFMIGANCLDVYEFAKIINN